MHVDLRPATEAIQSGDLRRAHEICQQALALDSGNAEAISMLGIIAGRMGNHEVAARMMADALMLRPRDNHYRWNYINALLSLERLDEAKECVDKGLAMQPGQPGLLSMKGIIAGRQGDLEAAIEAMESAAKTLPGEAQIQYNLGELYRRNDQGDKATESFNRCLELDPKHSDALNNLAGIQLAEGEFIEALRYIERHLEASPRSAQGYANLSVAMQAGGDVRQAITCLRNALTIDPSLKDIRFRLIGFLISSGQFDDAERELSAWQAEQPDNERLLAVQARMLERQGQLAEARETYETIAAEHREDLPVMLTNAILLDAEGKTQEAVDVLGQIMENEPDAMERIGIRFMLGKCNDSLGNNDEAFEHYSEGNQRRRKGFGAPFQPEQSTKVRDATIDAYRTAWSERVAGSGCPSDKPIFIVGMPRSGTSLTEQILGAHHDVFPAGELQALSRQIRETLDQGLPADQSAAFAIIDHEKDGSNNPLMPADFDPQTLHKIGQGYVDEITELGGDAKHVTDKMPYNFLFVPLINMVLPNAKIIHTRRNALDICLSCFFQNFTGGSEYAFDLEDLAVYYRNYAHTMDVWRNELGVEMLEIDYESLVSDPEPVVRQMLDYCGLDWDPNCMQSHESKRVVATASYQQVREPIYTKSVERWKRYEQQLTPLIEGLGDLVLVKE